MCHVFIYLVDGQYQGVADHVALEKTIVSILKGLGDNISQLGLDEVTIKLCVLKLHLLDRLDFV